MISVKCPHCHVGLKVDEGKIPLGLTSFRCPKCKGEIPVTSLTNRISQSEPETVLIRPVRQTTGKLIVVSDDLTAEQFFPLTEGLHIVGRNSHTSKATICIVTEDKSMSRAHIQIEVKPDGKGGYRHLLSDNYSKNHTLYNGNMLEEGEVVVLRSGDEIMIGRTLLRFDD